MATTLAVFVGLQTGRGVPTDLLFILGAAFVTLTMLPALTALVLQWQQTRRLSGAP